MNGFQRVGGLAALIEAATYLVGIVLAFTLLAPYALGELGPAESIAFLADNFAVMYSWNLIIYLVAGVSLVVLVLALHERLKDGAPAPTRVATAFGLIWSVTVIGSGMIILNDMGVVVDLYRQDPELALPVWLALHAVENGLGGGIELPGGMWVLLISFAALWTRGLPRLLNYLGLVIGVAGILTVIPVLSDAGSVFGLGFILWFLWAGIVMLSGGSGARA